MNQTMNFNSDFQTSNQTYAKHDVSNAFVIAEDIRGKRADFKKTHFDFGFHGRACPGTAVGKSRRFDGEIPSGIVSKGLIEIYRQVALLRTIRTKSRY